MDSKKIIEQHDQNVMHSYGRLPVALTSGKGAVCEDADGVSYIDFGSGIGTNSLGFADEQWANAVAAQAGRIQHISNYFYSEVSMKVAAALNERLSTNAVFFGNSGAEANECAIKIARKYSFDKYGKGRHNIITLVNSFHGRTMATLSATGQESFHNYFFPFVEGFRFVPANDIAALRDAADDTVCAVMFECVQGEGGVVPLEQDFVDEIFRIAKEKDILTIADEVQTGVGRTGKFIACEHFGVKPDIVTLAKGLGGGLPIGVCCARGAAAEVLTPGTHGSTFGGNPVVCAGALTVLDRLTPEFMEEIRRKAEKFRSSLLKMGKVTAVTGKGLMIGIELSGITAGEALTAARERQLLCLTAKEKLRLLPPLTIDDEQIEKGLAVLSEILA
ncbi:MAG: aspartate aminotransferase family protein [Oscillospiraceae bacterium]|jgi:acetylornithine/N-succinyldiaminopimelate aminotransferase|nr:aspartate aminotransferase family protein [Oscillospiraceae bacterium]